LVIFEEFAPNSGTITELLEMLDGMDPLEEELELPIITPPDELELEETLEAELLLEACMFLSRWRKDALEVNASSNRIPIRHLVLIGFII
jgi:hypothetical protein